jgi:polysaccharide export outer membrane protein
MSIPWSHLRVLTVFCALPLASCNLVSETGPLKNAIQSGSDSFQLVEVKSRADIPVLENSKGKSTIPPTIRGDGYSEKVIARDTLHFIITDMSEQSPFFTRGDPFKFGPLEIPENGQVNVPYIGEVNVLGRLLTDISKELEDRSHSISNTARVSVIRSARYDLTANVIGEVKKAGPVPLIRKGISSVDLLAASGGPTEAEHLYRYTYRRGNTDYIFDSAGFRKNPFPVEEGDLLSITEDMSHRFHVMGAINRPITVPFPSPSPTLADALGSATGLDERRSDPSGVFIFRKGSPDQVYTFNMKDPAIIPLIQRFPVKGEDIVYVTEAPLVRWNRLISQLLPTSVSQAANSSARFYNN